MPGPVRDRTIAQPSRASANRDADRPAPVEHAFAECGRKLGGGLHAAYLNTHAKGKSASPVSKVKLELYALLQDDRVIQRVPLQLDLGYGRGALAFGVGIEV